MHQDSVYGCPKISMVPGEYGLMFMLAMGMMFVLLLANGNAQFGRSRIMQPPWPQPRQDVPGWAALHLSYIDKIAQASANQVSGQHLTQNRYASSLRALF